MKNSLWWFLLNFFIVTIISSSNINAQESQGLSAGPIPDYLIQAGEIHNDYGEEIPTDFMATLGYGYGNQLLQVLSLPLLQENISISGMQAM